MKKSTGRVQPKKETVRINLPPKPTAAPTIKLPTLPPGGPTGAGGSPLGAYAAQRDQFAIAGHAGRPAFPGGRARRRAGRATTFRTETRCGSFGHEPGG